MPKDDMALADDKVEDLIRFGFKMDQEKVI